MTPIKREYKLIDSKGSLIANVISSKTIVVLDEIAYNGERYLVVEKPLDGSLKVERRGDIIIVV